ncbi:MAG: hypothetical protein WD898_00455 [Candidatus Paceibacterota bacterium]
MPLNIEQEIAQIEQNLASKRAELDRQKESGEISEVPHEKETLKEVVGEKISPVIPAPVSPAPQQPVPTPPPVVDTPSYLSPELKDKVQELVNTAFNKTIEDAIKEAKSTNNPALIDAFHDALVDELYDQLVERGKLRPL